MGAGVFRVEFDGLAVAGTCLAQLPFCLQRVAEVVVSVDIVWFEPQGLAGRGDGLVMGAAVLECVAEVEMRSGTARAEGHRGREEAHGLLRSSGLDVGGEAEP